MTIGHYDGPDTNYVDKVRLHGIKAQLIDTVSNTIVNSAVHNRHMIASRVAEDIEKWINQHADGNAKNFQGEVGMMNTMGILQRALHDIAQHQQELGEYAAVIGLEDDMKADEKEADKKAKTDRNVGDDYS